MAGADPEDIHGWHVSELLPRPVPYRFRLLGPVERGWRGRAAIRLWLLGYSVRSAWLYALSKDADWSAYLSHEHLDLVDDWRLPGEVLRQRLMEVVESNDQNPDVHVQRGINPSPFEGQWMRKGLDTPRTL